MEKLWGKRKFDKSNLMLQEALNILTKGKDVKTKTS